MTSILDQLEESRVDVRTMARNDISGSAYHLEPFRFRYLLDVPMEIVDMTSPGIEAYVADVDYIFSSFTTDYQILLRKIAQNDKSYDNYPQLPMNELQMIDMNDYKTSDRYRYSGALFVQFNIDPDWSYKTTYRFLKSITRLFEKHERLDYKYVYIYKRTADLRDCVCIDEEVDNLVNKKRIFIRYNRQSEFKLTDDTPIEVAIKDIVDSKPVAEVLFITEEWDTAILCKKLRNLKSFNDLIVKDVPIMSYNERGRYLLQLSKAFNEKYCASVIHTEEFFKKYVTRQFKKRQR